MKKKNVSDIEFVKELFTVAKRMKAGTVISSMRDCGLYDGGDVFVIVAVKGTEPSDILGTLAETLYSK